MKVAIFASGNGTNYEVLAEHFQKGDLPGDLALLFCDHPDAPVIKRAEKFHTPVVTLRSSPAAASKSTKKRSFES